MNLKVSYVYCKSFINTTDFTNNIFDSRNKYVWHESNKQNKVCEESYFDNFQLMTCFSDHSQSIQLLSQSHSEIKSTNLDILSPFKIFFLAVRTRMDYLHKIDSYNNVAKLYYGWYNKNQSKIRDLTRCLIVILIMLN